MQNRKNYRHAVKAIELKVLYQINISMNYIVRYQVKRLINAKYIVAV